MHQQPELPRDYREMLDKFATAMGQAKAQAVEEAVGLTPEKREMTEAFVTCLKDLRYPVAKDGSVMNADFFAPIVAYHLVRCGWRPNSEKRVIKPRSVPGPGVVEGAIEWVDMDAEDDPLTRLDSMSMKDVAMLPDVWRHEAIRRLGGNTASDLPKPKGGWEVTTKMNIANAERDPNKVFK